MENLLGSLDIIAIAKNILSEVDATRSYAREKDQTSGEGARTPNESMLNAFFRMVGLPMCVTVKMTKIGGQQSEQTKNRVLSPGFLPAGFFGTDVAAYSLSNAEKFGDYNNFSQILLARERALQKQAQNVGNTIMDGYMSYALYEPLDLVPNFPDSKTSVSSAVFGKYDRQVFKMLMPMVTALPVDSSGMFTRIQPQENELARPFAPLREGVRGVSYLKRPFIETVIRIRLVTAESASNTATNEKGQQFVSSLESMLPGADLSSISNDYASLGLGDVLGEFIYSRLFSVLLQLAQKWAKLNKYRKEFKDSYGSVLVKAQTDAAKRSPFGRRIAQGTDTSVTGQIRPLLVGLKQQVAKEQLYLNLLPSEDEIGAFEKSFGTSQTGNAVNSALTNSLMTILSSNLEQLKKKEREEDDKTKKILQAADTLRLALELMTGEFTGLSIIDVIAVMLGLFIMDKKDLLALLDKEALDNMKNSKDSGIQSAYEKYGTGAGADAMASMASAINNLEAAVEEVYDILNSLIKAEMNKSKRTGSSTASSKQQGSQQDQESKTPPSVSDLGKQAVKSENES